MLLDFWGRSFPNSWWKDELNTDTPESKCNLFLQSFCLQNFCQRSVGATLVDSVQLHFVFSSLMAISVFMLCRSRKQQTFCHQITLCSFRSLRFFDWPTSCGHKGVLGGSPGDPVESLHNPGSSPALPDFREHMELLRAAPASPGGAGGSQRCLKGSSELPILHQFPLMSLGIVVALGPVLVHKAL